MTIRIQTARNIILIVQFIAISLFRNVRVPVQFKAGIHSAV